MMLSLLVCNYQAQTVTLFSALDNQSVKLMHLQVTWICRNVNHIAIEFSLPFLTDNYIQKNRNFNTN